MSARMCTQSFVALRIKKALGIFRERRTRTTRTTTVAFWDPPSGSKNKTGTFYRPLWLSEFYHIVCRTPTLVYLSQLCPLTDILSCRSIWRSINHCVLYVPRIRVRWVCAEAEATLSARAAPQLYLCLPNITLRKRWWWRTVETTNDVPVYWELPPGLGIMFEQHHLINALAMTVQRVLQCSGD